MDFSAADVLDYVSNSPFQKIVPFRFNGIVQINNGILSLKGEYAGSEELSYLYAALGDSLRHKMLASNSSSVAAETFQYFAENRDGTLLITGSSVPSWFEKSVLSKLDQ